MAGLPQLRTLCSAADEDDAAECAGGDEGDSGDECAGAAGSAHGERRGGESRLGRGGRGGARDATGGDDEGGDSCSDAVETVGEAHSAEATEPTGEGKEVPKQGPVAASTTTPPPIIDAAVYHAGTKHILNLTVQDGGEQTASGTPKKERVERAELSVQQSSSPSLHALPPAASPGSPSSTIPSFSLPSLSSATSAPAPFPPCDTTSPSSAEHSRSHNQLSPSAEPSPVASVPTASGTTSCTGVDSRGIDFRISSTAISCVEVGKGWTFDSAARARLQVILKHFIGTRNYHNFTVRAAFLARSSSRYMVSAEVHTSLSRVIVHVMTIIRCSSRAFFVFACSMTAVTFPILRPLPPLLRPLLILSRRSVDCGRL